MKNKVIITADDYGVCNRIDHAIIVALRKRAITTVSAVVTHKTSIQRLERLFQLKKDMAKIGFDFGIGLHFCITSGKAIYKGSNASPSSLIDPEATDENKGEFHEIQGFPFSKIRTADLTIELLEQFRLIEGVIGLENIDHLANHHGVVYFEKKMFEAYAEVAASKNVPVRSPMSWHGKFKGVAKKLPDFDDRFLTPTARRGLKIGMWRKFGGILYGNVVKRMGFASDLNVRYPDVLCEYIYGQCEKSIDMGDEVIKHCLSQFSEKNGRPEISDANKKTITKAVLKREKSVQQIYSQRELEQDFSIELMFHLATPIPPPDDLLKGIDDNPNPHGINLDYFPTRDRELDLALNFKWDEHKTLLNLEYITYKELS